MKIALTSDSQPLTESSFERIKNREFVPERSLTGLKFFRDKARNERDLRELYRGRAPYELLQNADDAEASVAVFSLSSDGVAFAHNGRWFSVGNFRSLADGWSDKDPNECIGHKGLGFRSVLDLTPCPHLVQIDSSFLGIKFGWAVNNNHVQNTLSSANELKALFASWAQNGQRVCPVMGIPVLARKESLGGGLTAYNRFLMDRSLALTTMFWLPAKDPDLPKEIAEELSTEPITSGGAGQKRLTSFLVDEVDVVLPFLSSIKKILIMDGISLVGKAEMIVVSGSTSRRLISVTTDALSTNTNREFFQMTLKCPIPPNIRSAPGTPRAVKHLKEADLTLAVRMTGGEPVPDSDARFQVYFPTEQVTGFGFLVHGDFHVQPDRKYLVPGDYNNWLFREAARFAANEFMSELLRNHPARRVFSALAPTGRDGNNDTTFSLAFAKALRNRKAPFIPISAGNGLTSDVVLAPSSRSAAFWEERFANVISRVFPRKKAFVAAEHDELSSRSFMKFAGVEVAGHEMLLPLIESAGQGRKNSESAQWWYECYLNIANDEQLARSPRSTFTNRKLLLASSGEVLEIPGEEGLLVCLHPDHKSGSRNVPSLFAKTFAFLDKELSELLENGSDEISSWILNRFHISRFEASDLVPRAIRTVAPKLFDGSIQVESSQLTAVWRFVKDLVENSRSSFAEEFWATIGRLPVYSESEAMGENPSADALIPCATTYWPDEFLTPSAAIAGAGSLRRIHPDFCRQLCDGQDFSAWRDFLSRAGLGDSPKILSYARIAAGTEELVIDEGKPTGLSRFNGERQHDINRVITDAVARDRTWRGFVRSTSDCGHGVPRVVQNLTIIEGFADSCDLAEKEFHGNEQHWRDRLNSLIVHFPHNIDTQSPGTVYCRSGRQGGHTSLASSYVAQQLAEFRWLPSTAGPAGMNECFLRRSTHKLVSDTRSGENVNDWLLPSLVIDDPELFLRLVRLGVRQLEDSTAPTATLILALKEIGQRLSRKENAAWAFESPARWRAVRGAIQNVYRTLNQRNDLGVEIQQVRFATVGKDQITFDSLPLYYAEPGPIRDAFCGILPLIDSDRVFAGFFDAIGIVQLTPGSAVRENVKLDGRAVPNARLRTDIAEGLGPYLMAVGRAKTDSQSDSQPARRVLAERFTVLSVSDLKVEFSVANQNTLPPVSSPPLPFYLQRRVLERSRAISEAHYTLFVNSAPDAGIFDIDADALGSVLVPIFQDRPSADITAMFARTAVRYKDLRGDPAAMKEFMYTHLGVSYEVMALVDEEDSVESDSLEVDILPPPPAKLVGQMTDHGEPTLAQVIAAKEDEIRRKAVDAVGRVARSAHGAGAHSGTVASGASQPITPEQRARGLAGELEIKRRLSRPGGWEGLTLFRDTRDDGCGFDFEAKQGERTVRIEVKTFSGDGRVVLTNRELQAAAEYKADYYLIGVQDSVPVQANQWPTYLMHDPLLRLMTLGEFIVESKLQVDAERLFEFRENALGLNG